MSYFLTLNVGYFVCVNLIAKNELNSGVLHILLIILL